jgi:hypothetical protein
MRPQRPIRAGQTATIQEGAIGAFQIAHPPAAIGRKDLGVLAADGTVVDTDLQRFQAPDPQASRRLPDAVFAVVANAAQTNGTHYPNLLSHNSLSGRGSNRLLAADVSEL